MLSSSDIFVSHIAKAELLQSVRFAAQDNPSPSLIYEFLSGSSTCGNFHPNKIRYRKQSICPIILSSPESVFLCSWQRRSINCFPR